MIIARALAAIGAAAGLLAWVLYLRADLVLVHYDAKAHLVVARRILDNITPGWQQIGAVWLPLPHLLNAIPIQVDLFYRTGAFASWLSIGCLAVTVYATARLVLLMTGSRLGAVVAAALLILNPNVLYLHATPLTEPLLLASTFLMVLWLAEWVPLNQDAVPLRLGLVMFAAAWTRYEAWFVIVAALGLTLYAASRIGASAATLVRRASRLVVWPAAAIALFLVNSRLTVGAWFVSGGFFVPDPGYEGQLARSLLAVWWGTHQLSTRTTEIVALAGAAAFTIRALIRRAEAPFLIPVALFASAALPFFAFYEGHPFRMRYMIPLAAACALFSGVAVGLLQRQAPLVLAGVLVGITLLQSPPWRRDAPLLVEAQWDVTTRDERRQVTTCLERGYQDEKIVASMGSLAHFMQELSHAGLDIEDFVHEGNGVIWDRVLETGPAAHAGWMLVEEQAEGGDALARRIREDPAFARGMERVCDGGGVALYQRLSLLSKSPAHGELIRPAAQVDP